MLISASTFANHQRRATAQLETLETTEEMLATSMRRAARCALQTRAVRVACVARNTNSLAPAIARAAFRSFSAASDSSNGAANSNNSNGNGAPPSHVIDAVDENRFLELADTALHDIMSWLDGVEEMLEESDVSLSVRTHKRTNAERVTLSLVWRQSRIRHWTT